MKSQLKLRPSLLRSNVLHCLPCIPHIQTREYCYSAEEEGDEHNQSIYNIHRGVLNKYDNDDNDEYDDYYDNDDCDDIDDNDDNDDNDYQKN